MRTRCPACSTAFRVTSEQLRLKAGKVRCGQCQVVFNAFDSLIDESLRAPIESPSEPLPPGAIPSTAADASAPDTYPEALPEPEFSRADSPEIADEPLPAMPEAPTQETVAESTRAARDAGLVAARELADTPAYDRWAAGTLAGNNATSFEPDQSRQATWPFVLTTLILALLLALQLLYYFRTAVVQRLPEAAALYALAAVNVPLPQHSDLVDIEVSDLQSDNARGLLVLQATLRNRAPFAQAWPALELTLTDMHDAVISRRVIQAREYLPPGTTTPAFPARSDMAIRLWLEAKGVGAAGYRLYLFYP